MGCDIHTMAEVKGEYGWLNAGEINEDRNYQLFGLLAGVRDDSVKPIASPRGVPSDCTSAYDAWAKGDDWHNHSYLTLAELQKAYTEHKDGDAFMLDGLMHMVSDLEQIMIRYNATPETVRVCFFFDN